MTDTKPQTTSERFWRWLASVADKKLEEEYTVRIGWDLKCPECQTWAHTKGIKLVSWNDRQNRYECLHCHKTTAWEFHGPLAISVPTVYWPERQHG